MTLKKVRIKDNKTVREKLDSITKGVLFDECKEKLINEKKELGSVNILELQQEMHLRTVMGIKEVFNNLRNEVLRFVEGKKEPLNCHAYALGIHESKTLLTRLGNHSGEVAFIDGNRMVSLIEKKHLTELTEPRVGSLVLYFDDMQSDKPTHAGIIKKLREDGNHIVESKWGELPAIFTDSLNTVPTDYGNYVAYFKKPSLEEVENMLDQILETENS